MANEFGHWLILIINIDGLKFILVNIYGYNISRENRNLLEQISLHLDNLKLTHSTDNIIIGGDLNLVHDDFFDKYPCRYAASHPNTIFTSFCEKQNLIDTWRHLNPEISKYSWFSSNHNYKSRIDHWLIANHLLAYDISSDISAAPLTDHRVILLQIKPNGNNIHSHTYWKFNSSLLKNNYCQKIKLYKEYANSEERTTATKKWEFIKYKIRQFTISFSKTIKKR